jgi:hypothetical protein
METPFPGPDPSNGAGLRPRPQSSFSYTEKGGRRTFGPLALVFAEAAEVNRVS